MRIVAAALLDALRRGVRIELIGDPRTPRATVITGSYNLTHAAQSRNAENVVLITGNRSITDRYVRNFEMHLRQSAPWP